MHNSDDGSVEERTRYETAAKILATYRLYAAELRASRTWEHVALLAEQRSGRKPLRHPADDRERS